ncbi:hypothetical protein A3A46_00210 [Candidatus Roizmanbacteria bacterium RIFCSPLOWO2_01_FULL_37_13]|uniref:GIY-YIG domain-containing protein n=1 Tax=Candidatus Roizmanbacteria bacterium RIFCSPHIGHO2_02_FULL_38_11 TaxID=1802039 RepID=A0A1F7H403_9BACT|nr:MAG: hypothetical protein A3C25_02845 [Candidatus Roizmanbacteria bacterium RIFCSPHIGHO2_02_FULL_38_11]OGK42320.1 MAG: hypothetical protein A3A46_00210 [Candidatus Roizmanbacteria bacterium RIFCSPLOWO2_01_FULL_37_13]
MVNTKNYFIYIATNKTNTVLYTGITNNLVKRIYQHKNKIVSSFSSKYNINKLVYYEVFQDVNDTIKREKQIKAGSRKKKLELVKKMNPYFEDLYKTIL